jgi:hypothetical protein
LKAIWLRQPYPTLIEIGVKQWETRGGPPNGPMRPDGVRGMPGLAIEPGERIAIVASVNRPVGVRELGEWVMFHGGGLVPCMAVASEPIPTPLGVVVCTAVVAEALPIVDDADDLADEPACIEVAPNGSKLVLLSEGDSDGSDISDQLPYGDWRPGRWAWRLTDAEPVQSRPAPEVTRGNRQGVCEIKETW